MLPSKCPYLNRCNKYTELTCRIDRQKDIIAEKDREIAKLKKENAELKIDIEKYKENEANRYE